MNTLPVQQRTFQNIGAKPLLQPNKSIDMQRFVTGLRAFVESEEVVKSLIQMIEKNIFLMAKMQSPTNILNAEPGSFSGFGTSSPLANAQGAGNQSSDKAIPPAAEKPQNIVLFETSEKKPDREFKMAEMNTHILSENSILNMTATKDLFSLNSTDSAESSSATMSGMNATSSTAQSTSAFSLSVPQMMGSVGASTAPSTASSSPIIPQMMGSTPTNTGAQTAESVFSVAVPSFGLSSSVIQKSAIPIDDAKAVTLPSFGLDESKATIASLNDFFKL